MLQLILAIKFLYRILPPNKVVKLDCFTIRTFLLSETRILRALYKPVGRSVSTDNSPYLYRILPPNKVVKLDCFTIRTFLLSETRISRALYKPVGRSVSTFNFPYSISGSSAVGSQQSSATNCFSDDCVGRVGSQTRMCGPWVINRVCATNWVPGYCV